MKIYNRLKLPGIRQLEVIKREAPYSSLVETRHDPIHLSSGDTSTEYIIIEICKWKTLDLSRKQYIIERIVNDAFHFPYYIYKNLFTSYIKKILNYLEES